MKRRSGLEGVGGMEKRLGRSEWDGEAAWKEWVGQRTGLEGVSGGLERVSETERWLGRSE